MQSTVSAKFSLWIVVEFPLGFLNNLVSLFMVDKQLMQRRILPVEESQSLGVPEDVMSIQWHIRLFYQFGDLWCPGCKVVLRDVITDMDTFFLWLDYKNALFSRVFPFFFERAWPNIARVAIWICWAPPWLLKAMFREKQAEQKAIRLRIDYYRW